jgi:hypothetical protein
MVNTIPPTAQMDVLNALSKPTDKKNVWNVKIHHGFTTRYSTNAGIVIAQTTSDLITLRDAWLVHNSAKHVNLIRPILLNVLNVL